MAAGQNTPAAGATIGSDYYRTTLTAQERQGYAPLTTARDADVCIVGGGLAGVNLALSLAERGRKVVLLERKHLAAEASGRNAGFVAKGFAAGDLALIGKTGLETARALVELTKNARLMIRKRVAEYNIDCQPMKDGVLTVSWKDDPQALKDRIARTNDAFNLGFEFWPRLRVREHCNTERYYDGIYSPYDFQFNPLKYLLGLARAAVEKGAEIYENSEAAEIEREGAVWKVRTVAGVVTARDVVLCGGASTHGLSRRLDYSVAPVRTYIMVTAPMSEQVYERSVNTELAIYDTRFASDYYRRLPEGRLLWGGRVSLFAHPANIAQGLTSDALKVYPQLKGHIRPEFAWGGVLAYPPHKMPMLARLKDGLWSCTGFGGHGICPTTVAGEVMATALTLPAIEQLKALQHFAAFKPSFIGGPLASVGAQLVYLWWRLRDQLGY